MQATTQLEKLRDTSFSLRDVQSWDSQDVIFSITVSTPKAHEQQGRVEATKPCSCIKHEFRAIYEDKGDPQKIFLLIINFSEIKITNFSVWSLRRCRLEPTQFGQSRLSDFRSRQKNWPLLPSLYWPFACFKGLFILCVCLFYNISMSF